MIQDKNNRKFIFTSTSYGICISIVLVAGIILVVNGYKTVGFMVTGTSCLALCIFLMLFIPNTQHLKITDQALNISAYRYHRSYFWDHIYDVCLKKQQRENAASVIIKISKSSVHNMDSEIIPYMEIPIDAQAFGLDPKELYKKIKEKILIRPKL